MYKCPDCKDVLKEIEEIIRKNQAPLGIVDKEQLAQSILTLIRKREIKARIEEHSKFLEDCDYVNGLEQQLKEVGDI